MFGKLSDELIKRRAVVKGFMFIGACVGVYFVWNVTEQTMGKELPPEPWSTHPPEEWPHFVLTNVASFEGHTPLSGENAWLVELDEDHIVAATSRFMLDGKRSLRPRLPLEELESKMTGWKLSRPDRPDESITVSGLHGDPATYKTSVQDCLLLDVDTSTTPLPARALKLRPGMPPDLGARVFVLSSSPSTGQQVRPGFVVGVTMGFIRCRLEADALGEESPDEPTDGGAAVIDTRGHLLGLVAGQTPGPNEEDGVFVVHGVRTLLNKL